MAVYVLICRGRRPDRTGTAETQTQVIAYFIHKNKTKNGGKAFQYCNTAAQRPALSSQNFWTEWVMSLHTDSNANCVICIYTFLKYIT